MTSWREKRILKKPESCIFQIMYLNLTLVPLIQILFWIFLFVNRFFYICSFKKSAFKCLFLFYFYNKNPKWNFLSTFAVLFTYPSSRVIEHLGIDTRLYWFPSAKINNGFQLTCLKAHVSSVLEDQEHQLLLRCSALALKPLTYGLL